MIVDLIKDLITNWNIELNVKSVLDNNDGTFTLSVCNTFHLVEYKESYTVTIDDYNYTIIEVIENESIKLKGTQNPTIGKKNINNLHFVHGTVQMANNELTLQPNVFAKTPMVYLKRPIDFIKKRKGAFEYEIDLTIFFLTQADFDSWNQEAYDKYAIKPMYNLAKAFIEKINRNNNFNKTQDVSYFESIRFGTYIDKGAEKQYFNDTLSGIRIEFKLETNIINCNC